MTGNTGLADAAHWHYQGPENACAVVAQGSIIESLTGHPFDQAAAVAYLESHGLYDPEHGTRLDQVGALFDLNGIAHTDGPADLSTLADALAHGDKVLVGLDAHEIWNPEHDASGYPIDQVQSAGHAVWVTDIGQDAHGQWQVVVNDSGQPEGAGVCVGLADFLNAWHDYGNFTVIAHAGGAGHG